MLGQRVVAYVNTRMQQEHSRLNHLAHRIPMLFSLVKTRQGAVIDRLEQQILSLMRQQLSQVRYRLELLHGRTLPALTQKLNTEKHRLEQYDLRLKAVDPQIILQRGYSLTTLHGKTIREASMIKEGDVIVTRFAKGAVSSIVQSHQQNHHA